MWFDCADANGATIKPIAKQDSRSGRKKKDLVEMTIPDNQKQNSTGIWMSKEGGKDAVESAGIPQPQTSSVRLL